MGQQHGDIAIARECCLQGLLDQARSTGMQMLTMPGLMLIATAGPATNPTIGESRSLGGTGKTVSSYP